MKKLCEAARQIHPTVEISLLGIPDRDDFWVVRISVGAIILVETAPGLLDMVQEEALKKLKRLSQRVLVAVGVNGDDPKVESTLPPPPKVPEKP